LTGRDCARAAESARATKSRIAPGERSSRMQHAGDHRVGHGKLASANNLCVSASSMSSPGSRSGNDYERRKTRSKIGKLMRPGRGRFPSSQEKRAGWSLPLRSAPNNAESRASATGAESTSSIASGPRGRFSESRAQKPLLQPDILLQIVTRCVFAAALRAVKSCRCNRPSRPGIDERHGLRILPARLSSRRAKS